MRLESKRNARHSCRGCAIESTGLSVYTERERERESSSVRLRASRACGVAHTDLWYYPPCAGVARRPGEGRRHSSLMLESWTRRACPGALSPVGLALGRRRAACSVGHRTRRGLHRTSAPPTLEACAAHEARRTLYIFPFSFVQIQILFGRFKDGEKITPARRHGSRDTVHRTRRAGPRHDSPAREP